MSGASATRDVVVSMVLFRTPADEVASCVGQVLASRRRTRVVIVDNSPEPTPLPEWPADRVTILRPGANLGYGRAHNAAIALTRGEAPLHLVMNTDVTLCGDVIDELAVFMETHPEAGLASPLIRYPDGRLQTQCRLLPTPANMFARGFLDRSGWNRRMNRRYELLDWGYDSIETVPFVSGCFMMIRSDVLAATGGFDERFFLFAEDLDLSRRINQLSRCVFVPTSSIRHELRTRVKLNWRRHAHKVANLIRYFNKWGWLRDDERRRVNDEAWQRIVGRGTPGPDARPPAHPPSAASG